MQPGDFNLDLQVDLGRKSSKSASGEAKKFNTINVTRKGGRPRSEPELSISFHRTVRVTDNDDSVNALPPNLGKFPLYKTDDFEKRLPSNIEKSGKILLPMYQREAMWINFSGNERFAIRIYVGGVNVVSGLSVLENPTTLLKRWKMYEENKSLQDYVVVPDQLWLDGVASEDGSIRQFVAMPTGSGYSVEAQITGEEAIRGIQFEITPAKYNGWDHVFVQLSNGRSLVLNHLEPHMRISRLKSMIRDETGVPIVQQRLVFAGVQLENERSLASYDIQSGSAIQNVLRLRGGGFGSQTESVCSEGTERETDGDMGMSIGGHIKQSIVSDPYPADSWDSSHTLMFNVQIVNSESFQALTGVAPPTTPLTAAQCANLGLHYFDIWDEKQSGVKGDFEGVNSVNSLDKVGFMRGLQKKSVQEVNTTYNNPIVPLDQYGRRLPFVPVQYRNEQMKSAIARVKEPKTEGTSMLSEFLADLANQMPPQSGESDSDTMETESTTTLNGN